jgi:hypothetical protein
MDMKRFYLDMCKGNSRYGTLPIQNILYHVVDHIIIECMILKLPSSGNNKINLNTRYYF